MFSTTLTHLPRCDFLAWILVKLLPTFYRNYALILRITVVATGLSARVAEIRENVYKNAHKRCVPGANKKSPAPALTLLPAVL